MGCIIHRSFIQQDEVLVGGSPTNIKSAIAISGGFNPGKQLDGF